jgi:shikimate 5-dehydrogenase
MMNNDNTITTETALFGFIAEEAHSNRFSLTVNKLYKANGVNAMAIPMNIRPDDVAFTISQMRSSKLSGAVIGIEYQEDAFALLDHASALVQESGYCDFIRIVNGELMGELLMPRALEKYAQNETFEEDIALNSMCHYFYELTIGENNE